MTKLKRESVNKGKRSAPVPYYFRAAQRRVLMAALGVRSDNCTGTVIKITVLEMT